MIANKMIVLFFLLVSWCTSRSQVHDSIVRIEFNSLARGFHEQVVITPDSVSVLKKGSKTEEKDKSYTRVLDKEEWEKLINSLNDVLLSDIPELKSPTRNRTFDGATHSSIVITVKNDQSWGHAFDDENPHKKLQLLMNTIREIANRRTDR